MRRHVQENSRFGVTLSVPIKGRHSINLGYAVGIVTVFGTDFDQFLMSYQVLLKQIIGDLVQAPGSAGRQ